MGVSSNQFLHLLCGAPLDKYLCKLYGAPLGSVSTLTIGGPLRSVSSLTIWGPLRPVSSNNICPPPSGRFHHLPYGGPLRSISSLASWGPLISDSTHTIWGGGGGVPSQVSFFTYYRTTARLTFMIQMWSRKKLHCLLCGSPTFIFIICLFRKHSPYKNCANYA